MGTSVLTPTFRYHPVIVAQAFATLGCLFPDRVVLGMGTGESLNEVTLGIEWPDGKERFARFREAVKLIRQVWSEERVSFEGDTTAPTSDHLRPAGEPGADLPGRVGSGGHPVRRPSGRRIHHDLGQGPGLYTDTLLPAVKEGAGKAGRSTEDIDMMIEVKVSFDHDRDVAMQDTRSGARWGCPPSRSTVWRPGGDAAAGRRAVRRADRQAVHRLHRPGRARGEDQELPRPGFTHLVFHAPGPDQEKFLKLYGEEILPRLRTL